MAMVAVMVVAVAVVAVLVVITSGRADAAAIEVAIVAC